MNVGRDEARQALAAIEAVQAHTRRSIHRAGGGAILVTWGAVWLVGWLCSQFVTGPLVGLLWMALDVAGIAGTLLVVRRVARRVHDPLGPRIGALWLALMIFIVLMLWIAAPIEPLQVGALIALAVMFGYAVMGLWLDRVFLWIAVAVTAIILVGYLALPAWFGLWMAIAGGGALAGSGLYIQRGWR